MTTTSVSRSNVDFSQALLWYMEGNPIARSGWNGKGMHVFKCSHSIIYPENSDGVLSLLTPFACIQESSGTLQPGWLPSQADLHASDWELLSFEDPQGSDDTQSKS